MKIPSSRRFLIPALLPLALMASGSAHAIFRAYLSVTGNDANPCTVTAPCRLLPAALTAVDAGGEIWMLDSANFNTSTVSITKSVTILAITGELGSVVGNGGAAFTINGAGIDVTLQNLNILGLPGAFADIGVNISNAAKVNVVNCTISRFTGNGSNGLGIWVNAGVNTPKVNVIGSIIRGNAHGIVVAGNGSATISKTHVIGNAGNGIWANSGTGLVSVHVSDSVSSGNGSGFVATGDSQSVFSYLNVTRSIATENVNYGFVADGGTLGAVVVGDSMATHNGVGFASLSGGNLGSRGNNTVIFNNGSNVGPIQPVSGT